MPDTRITAITVGNHGYRVLRGTSDGAVMMGIVFGKQPRPGRPAGPTPDRGMKSYDPVRGTAKREVIVRAIHAFRGDLENGTLLLSDLALVIGTSFSYLSLVKNSAWGQRRLAALAAEDARRQTKPVRGT